MSSASTLGLVRLRDLCPLVQCITTDASFDLTKRMLSAIGARGTRVLMHPGSMSLNSTSRYFDNFVYGRDCMSLSISLAPPSPCLEAKILDG